ncbi:DUF992 domain-containing protein [Rhizobium leguminosarum]|uniref:DUF992 domain-containing protein n=1 Tax=Rhizobium leguminosarum TaxID=384 RepID=UPI001C95FCDF|nr:DUF992 domain-containing protein [Rhizobium leguminosarum]MBY5705723.1 DUF992 domain-containing protein [Rhizobium leguminosarum]
MRKLPFYAAASIFMMAATTASAAEHISVGKLDCDVSAGMGVIIGSEREVNCSFTPTADGNLENYSGKITEFGLDIGTISEAKLEWLVYAPASRQQDALSGTYAGVSADAAVGLGLGAKILVGGQQGTVSLQPVSIEGDVGFNVAVGISALSLRPVH